MNLDEAIKHAEEMSKEDLVFAKDHKQLAEWLTELKTRREQDDYERSEVIDNIVVNYGSKEVRDRFLYEHMALYPYVRSLSMKMVAFHRKMLGKSKIAYGNRQYHSWRRPTWVVFVNNGYGIKFEVIPGPDNWKDLEKNSAKFVELALEAWADYLAAIQFSPGPNAGRHQSP